MFDPEKNKEQLIEFSKLAKARNQDIVLKIFVSSKSNQKSYDMKIDRGGAFTEFLFNTNAENIVYWQKKWLGKVPNPKFAHDSKP